MERCPNRRCEIRAHAPRCRRPGRQVAVGPTRQAISSRSGAPTRSLVRGCADLGGIIAVEARRFHHQRALRRVGGTKVQIDQRKEDLGLRGRPPQPVQPCPPVALPVGGPPVALGLLGAGVHRHEFPVLAVRGGRHDAVDGEDLDLVGPAGVGDDGVFRHPLGDLDGLGPLGKQVHDRRAAQAERIARNVRLEVGSGAVEEEVNVEFPGTRRGRVAVDPAQIKEQELAGKDEVVGQQPVTRERPGIVRQQALGGMETDGLHVFGREGAGRRVARRRREGDLRAAIQEDLVKRHGVVVLAANEEPQRFQGGENPRR